LASAEQLTERILHRLSLDMQVRPLAERLLHRFAETVGDLPASERYPSQATSRRSTPARDVHARALAEAPEVEQRGRNNKTNKTKD
jgi:hypothetical protein